MPKKNMRVVRTASSATERTWLSYVATLDENGVYKELHTRRSGLGEEEVEASREQYGENIMQTMKRTPAPLRFLAAFGDPFVLILVVLGFVSLGTDVIFAKPGEGDPTTAILIFGMVLVSVTLRFVQESRGSDAAAALAETIETTCCVERQGMGRAEIGLDEVVRGDIVHLAAGDMIPADLRLVAARDLFVGQSSLTGEADAVEKNDFPTEGLVQPLDAANLVYMGSTVISGTGIGVAVEVGSSTMLGSISASLSTTKKETAYNRGIADVSALLVRLMLIVTPIVLVINGVTKGNWLDALLFALSVAVGLTPEMLPMIVTTCLAKGAVDLSHERVIVKQLDAIQNLGSIDVLCCDKTGTLTEDRVVLEMHLDVLGDEDPVVLRNAFLNSHFETGMLNLIDTAIIDCAHHETGLDDRELVEDYYLIDELPFDYERRRVSVVVGDEQGNTLMITKGAIEEVLEVCNTVELKGAQHTLNDAGKAEVLERARSLSEDGMRVLGVAVRHNPPGALKLTNEDERDMCLTGYLAFLDPPKEDAAESIQELAELGVEVKVLTGDAAPVAASVCRQLGLDTNAILDGASVEQLSDEELIDAARETAVFAKLAPEQKTRVVSALQAGGANVGHMGDGVNDASAMRAADCGISVDTGADVAKEAADIILLEKDLHVLARGVAGGRKTFANMNKYVKLTASSNFGNIFSVLVASAFLPFLPMKAVQLLFLNFIYDLTCTAIPWDSVDEEELDRPKSWDAGSIGSFMRWFGPVSSVFDIVTYVLMFFVVCPAVCGGSWESLDAAGQLLFVGTFQAAWLMESMITQVLAVQLLRTNRKPFIESRASALLTGLELGGIVVAGVFCFTALSGPLDLVQLPLWVLGPILLICVGYAAALLILRKVKIAHTGSLL